VARYEEEPSDRHVKGNLAPWENIKTLTILVRNLPCAREGETRMLATGGFANAGLSYFKKHSSETTRQRSEDVPGGKKADVLVCTASSVEDNREDNSGGYLVPEVWGGGPLFHGKAQV